MKPLGIFGRIPLANPTQALDKCLAGIDLGGKKIEGVLMNGRSAEHPLSRLRIPTESARG